MNWEINVDNDDTEALSRRLPTEIPGARLYHQEALMMRQSFHVGCEGE
jgi:hypothetical protein